MTIAPASAHNLGVQGRTFPIGEVDMRLLEAQSLSHVNIKKIDAQMTRSAKEFPDHLKQFVLPAARETKTRWVDPSVVLNRNIEGMHRTAGGQWRWGVLWKQGTVVNPLKYVRPTTALLYINGLSSKQTALAASAVDQWPSRVVVIETQGDPVLLAHQLGMPVYMAKAHSLDRYQVKEVPSLVVPGPLRTGHAYDLRVTSLGLPYTGDNRIIGHILDQTWPADGVSLKLIKGSQKAYGGAAQ
ncbi:hypothetical protein [Acidihalobacter aeolianus]|uniref:hypothetical protein n=1 Tax=Acidihalobacter aeolianus TaxID=2792603 RepID=UPI0012EB00C1|nr:hypothetical protein [Acidihalobacter aeolianus]